MLSFSLSFSLSFALPFFLPTNNVYIYLYTHTYIHILHTHVHAYIDNSYVRCTYVRIFFRRILCEICLPLYSGRVADDDAKIGRSAFISSPFATFFHGRSILRVFPLPRHPSHVIFQKSDLRHLPKDAKIDSRYIYIFFFFLFLLLFFLYLYTRRAKGHSRVAAQCHVTRGHSSQPKPNRVSDRVRPVFSIPLLTKFFYLC